MNGCRYAVSGEPFCDTRPLGSNNFERRSDGVRAKKRLRFGSNSRAGCQVARDRSIAPTRSVDRRDLSSLRRVARNSSDYVSYETATIFNSQDSPRSYENFAHSRDGNWDRPVKGLGVR